jgi:hypothetical protein
MKLNIIPELLLAAIVGYEVRHTPAFLDHYLQVCRKAVLLVHRPPGVDVSGVTSMLDAYGDRVHYEIHDGVFSDPVMLGKLGEMVRRETGFTYVLHLDTDEFLERLDFLPNRMAEIHLRQCDVQVGAMVCRFGPGLTLIPDQLPTYDAYRAAAPVSTNIMKGLGHGHEKTWLTRWPEIRHHSPRPGERVPKHRDRIDHFRWTERMLDYTDTKMPHYGADCEGIVKDRRMVKRDPELLRIAREQFCPRSADLPCYFDYPDAYREIVDTAPEGATIVELGVYCGMSLGFMAEYATLLGKKLDLVGVDLFDACAFSDADATQHRSADEHWDQVNRDMDRFCPWNRPRLIRGFTADAAVEFADGSVYAVWVDADHSADGVEKDLRAWRPKLAPGGILAGHDHVMPSVQEGLRRAGVDAEPWSNTSWRAVSPCNSDTTTSHSIASE